MNEIEAKGKTIKQEYIEDVTQEIELSTSQNQQDTNEPNQSFQQSQVGHNVQRQSTSQNQTELKERHKTVNGMWVKFQKSLI